MKRFFAVLLMVCLVLTMVPFAGLASEKPVIVVGLPGDPLVENYDTNYMTLRLEEMTGVDLEFFLFPADKDNAISKLSLMVASNTKLPDVLCFEILDDATVLQYGSKGVFLPLEEYLGNADLMPHFNAIPETDRLYMQSSTKSPDGHNYGLPRYGTWAWNTGSYRMWYNENWLEKLNLKVPTTPDELYDVLTHFVNDDPNGNGLKDEIGLVGAKDGWAHNVITFVMNSFVYNNPDKQYLMVEDGQVKVSYTQEGWLEGLKFLNKLVNDGLLSTLSFTQDQAQLKALIQKEGGVAGLVPAGSYGAFSAGSALEFDEMKLLPPLVGENGECNVAYNPVVPTQVWFVTKDCADVESAIRVGDAFYEHETSMSSRYGEKGVEWDDDPEEAKLWANRFEANGVKTTFYSLDPEFWGQPQNKNWQDRNPKYATEAYDQGEGTIRYADMPAEGEPLTQAPDFNADFFKYYWPHMPEEYIVKLMYTEEETDKVAVIAADLINYVNEMSVAFITGSRPLDTWDDYLKELDKMGLQTYLEVVQVVYDRSK